MAPRQKPVDKDLETILLNCCLQRRKASLERAQRSGAEDIAGSGPGVQPMRAADRRGPHDQAAGHTGLWLARLQASGLRCSAGDTHLQQQRAPSPPPASAALRPPPLLGALAGPALGRPPLVTSRGPPAPLSGPGPAPFGPENRGRRLASASRTHAAGAPAIPLSASRRAHRPPTSAASPLTPPWTRNRSPAATGSAGLTSLRPRPRRKRRVGSGARAGLSLGSPGARVQVVGGEVTGGAGDAAAGDGPGSRRKAAGGRSRTARYGSPSLAPDGVVSLNPGHGPQWTSDPVQRGTLLRKGPPGP